jgi:fatty-acyl-CoA synthase
LLPGPAPLAQSYWRVEDDVLPIDLALKFDDLLDAAVAEVPSRDALVYRGAPTTLPARLTYVELGELVDRTARALLASGVSRGGVVAIYGPNRPEFVVLQFACARIGAALVPVNPLYPAAEAAYVLARSQAELCFAVGTFRDGNLYDVSAAIAADLPRLRAVVALDDTVDVAMSWQSWLAGDATQAPQDLDEARTRVLPSDVVLILFTSGTTGRPKGVRIRTNAMANAGKQVALRAELPDGCRMVHAMPFFHVGGTISGMAATLAVRGTHIALSMFSPAAMCTSIAEEVADATIGVPTMLIAMADHAEASGLDLSSLSCVLTGGSLVPESVSRRWIAGYGAGISNTYGMTEVSGPVIQTSPSDTSPDALVSVGTPLPGVAVEVVDPVTRERVPLGQQGEIRFRTWALMDGYEGDAEATAAVVTPDGWMHSGDLGTMNERGYVAVTGRMKEMIIRGGENIAPASIEDAIREHVPGVSDVSVVGVPDEYYGEVVAAFVKAEPGTELTPSGVRAALEGKIASFRVPRHVRVVDEFPTTPSGKIQKFRLAASFAQEAGGGGTAPPHADES